MGLKSAILQKAHAKSRTSSAIKSYSSSNTSPNAHSTRPAPAPDSYEAFVIQAERDEIQRQEIEKLAKKYIRSDAGQAGWNGGMGYNSFEAPDGSRDIGVGGLTPKRRQAKVKVERDGGTRAWLSGNGLSR